MKLKTFTPDNILNLDIHSEEIKDWILLCDMQLQSTMLAKVGVSLLEDFIKKKGEKQSLYSSTNFLCVVTFGLYYFNKDELLSLDLSNSELVKLFAKEEQFYIDFLEHYFNLEELDYNYRLSSVYGHLDKFEVRLDYAKTDIHLKIKNIHKIKLLKESLESNLENKAVVNNKPKV